MLLVKAAPPRQAALMQKGNWPDLYTYLSLSAALLLLCVQEAGKERNNEVWIVEVLGLETLCHWSSAGWYCTAAYWLENILFDPFIRSIINTIMINSIGIP